MYGPAGLLGFWASTARFMYRPDLDVSIREVTESEIVRRKECCIHCLPLSDTDVTSRTIGMSYICETNAKAGKFDIDKAVELGVPRGPMYSKLKSGEDISLPDGRVIYSRSVVAAAECGRCVGIVCAVAAVGVGQLIEQPAWKRYSLDLLHVW